MQNDILMACFFILAYFGLYCLIDLIDVQFRRKTENTGNIKLAIMVKNAEDDLEYKLRCFQQTAYESLMIDNKIFIIDMGLDDDTTKILEKISRDTETIEVFKFEEKERLFEAFEYDENNDKVG